MFVKGGLYSKGFECWEGLEIQYVNPSAVHIT